MKNADTYVIGDIHGALKALTQVLEESPFDISKDKLIFLGDYVDGWSESAQLIEHLIKLKSIMGDRVIFIRGNHDKWCENWLKTGEVHGIWYNHGGKVTIESYVKTGLMVGNSHLQFFKSMINFHVDDQNRGFVHGGYKSRKGIGHEVYQSDYYWDRDLWELSVALDGKVSKKDLSDPFDQYFRPNPYRMYKHKEIFLGHTTTCSYRIKPSYIESKDSRQSSEGGVTIPMNRCNVWNVDTGAGYNGKLTLLNIDTKEFYQSDFVKNLYQNERGRI